MLVRIKQQHDVIMIMTVRMERYMASSIIGMQLMTLGG